MHVEIEAHIRSALCAFVLDETFGLEPACRQATVGFRNIEIVPCPFPEDGQFSTSFPMKLHSELTAQGGAAAACSPLSLAEWFSRQLEKTGYFRVLVGGPGHLNISVESQLAVAFARAMLFQEDFFENIRPVSSAELLDDIPSRIPVDLATLAQKSADIEGGAALLHRFRESANPDDALMLVSLATDSESDAGPYLNELKSSQNWPWFLGRVRSIAFELQAVNVGSSQIETLSAAVMRKGCRSSPCMQLMGSLSEIRSAFYQARRFRGVNRVAPQILQLARQFSSVHNRPESRDASTEAFKTLAVLARPTYQALRAFFSAIDPTLPTSRS